MKHLIGIVETTGNLNSITNSIRQLTTSVSTVHLSDSLDPYTHIIIPGVGNIRNYSARLEAHSFSRRLKSFLQDPSRKVLGICVGFQYLSELSEEDISASCCKLLPLRFSRFSSSNSVRVPHVGWNSLLYPDNHALKHDQYFTHSFAAMLRSNQSFIPDLDEIAITEYSEPFVSYCRRANVFGIQSHPEKSRDFGLSFLRSFIHCP